MSPTPSLIAEDLHITYNVSSEAQVSVKTLLKTGFSGSIGEKVHAVCGVSLTVHEGESLGIVGTNGSGKSTLLQALAGLIPPTAGRVFANSQPMLLGVSAALRSGLSGWRNIEIGLLALGVSAKDIDQKVAEVADFADIGTALRRPLSTYSSGMRARVHFAIATAVEPKILMIDEALGVGDKDFKAKSFQRIDSLRNSAGAIVFVSHSPPEVERICDRVIWLKNGTIVADGPTDEVLTLYSST